jgi:hypothetical protein
VAGHAGPRWNLLDHCGATERRDDSHKAGHGGESGARRPLLDAARPVPTPAGTCETRGIFVTRQQEVFPGLAGRICGLASATGRGQGRTRHPCRQTVHRE